MVMEIPENCMDVQNALHLYVGADLEPEVQDAVTRHLDGCAGCRKLGDEARTAREALLGLGAATPPAPSVWGDVRAQLVREGRLAGAPVARRSPWWIVPAAAAASVAAVLVTLSWQRDVAPIAPEIDAPGAPQPIVLQPVEDGVRPLFEDAGSRAFPVHPSVPDASAAGNTTSRPVRRPIDRDEIIR